MKLYNTLTRTIEPFKAITDKRVSMYSCGPTVYDYQHIGNYSGYIYWDVLSRYLDYLGFTVKHVMNITDVGHLVSDQDEGEDKLEKGAAREGKSTRQVADFYTTDFMAGVKALNLKPPSQYAKATDFIDQQLQMVELLINQGFAYQTKQAIYFEVSKLADYGKLTGQRLADKEVAVRPQVVSDQNKRNPHDFAIWFFAVGRFATHEMRWPSKWGEGFPGWHLECSAIVHATLGDPIDIHTGGIDHIGTHHTNEIAQTEAAYKHQLANYWLHNNHLMVNDQKISKSLNNGYRLQDLDKKNYSPMDFKLFVLQSHYRKAGNFSWSNLEAAKNRLKQFEAMADLKWQTLNQPARLNKEEVLAQIFEPLGQDLNTPLALAQLGDFAAKLQAQGAADGDKSILQAILQAIDLVFGFELSNRPDIDESSQKLIVQRQKAKTASDYQEADRIRDQLDTLGIGLNDTADGCIWYRL